MLMMLAVTSVPSYLRSRGLSAISDGAWSVHQLTGGVSGAVYSAFDGDKRFVVKQSLEKLAVEDDWTAPRERILNEARVLDILGDVVPTHSPVVLDVDADTLTITMEHAPLDWGDWKGELLDGHVDVALTGNLGRALGAIHTATSKMTWQLPPDDGAAGFLELRIEPFHYTLAERLPAYADQVSQVADRVLPRQDCLVHGDFSPKNILVAPRQSENRPFWIIDDEVGHRGDPTFDLAFFLSHLALKRVRATSDIKPFFDEAAARFLVEYEVTGLPFGRQDLSEQIGCLVLSRIVGRSQVRYLTEAERQTAQDVGVALLTRSDEYTLDAPLTTA
ncbi:phosphotransferase family protein [Microbacterium sp. AK031]|uniref:phosphotransferase family protein n=1 Tax=Microbacterium sp. AK031 TaxID=2723076 RepID=UPI002167240D|nr:aminoglycoside phosphotransferase family protein [Microbacterium sp. AK031]MCS3845061.1 tRNA A-37 threonylcarbamoyl transferase component Bud32 [Microbacterium sp. AK031]